MERWSGRVALVTGASAGVGYQLAGRLAHHGLKVVACARNVDKIQELSSRLQSEKCSGSLTAIKCDLTKEDDISAMFSRIRSDHGGVDVLVNNAGCGHDAPLISGETWKFRNMLELNVLAVSICTREAVQSMRERGVDDGHVIHVSSVLGHHVGSSLGFYSATKHAVRALTEGLRAELRELNSHIRISSVSPGLIETDFLLKMVGEEKGQEMYKVTQTLKAEDIVDAIEYQLVAPPHVQIHDIIIRPTEQVW